MELLRALAVLAEPPTDGQAGLLGLLDLPGQPDGAAFADVFLFQLYPYASVYLGPEGMLGGEARDRIAGFFRALDVSPPAEPDHLTVLLSAYADLVDRESEAAVGATGEVAAAWRRSRSAMLWEHLLSWVPVYLDRVRDVAGEPYRSWAELLDEVLRGEAARVGGAAELPLHLRQAPPLPDPRDGDTAAFLAGLLAPSRSGMVVLRDDLVSACRELGLGLRIGERRFVLTSMLDQDPAATLQWLAGRARAAAERDLAWLGDVGAWWRDRAVATVHLLEEVATDADRLRADTIA
jgi:hypothetical protein